MRKKSTPSRPQGETLFHGDECREVITDISPRASNPNLRAIRVGRKTKAVLQSSDVEFLKLKVGDSWTRAVSEKVAALLTRQKARKAAMTLLGRRAYSRKEIVNRLISKGHDGSIAEQVGRELSTAGWINDADLADAVVHRVTRTRPAGRSLIRYKLQSRDIDPAVIEQSLARSRPSTNESAEALALSKKRLKKIAGLPNAAIRRRIAGLLARRGFNDDTIEDVLDRLQLSPPEPD